MRMRRLIWIPAPIASDIMSEADRWFDLETGGLFMGYWANETEVVVTAHIEAGPNARRERNRFEPDLGWQQERIDEQYARSRRLDQYLGDWHTHPRATTAHLSHTDRACARRIISTPSARQGHPVMMLLVGEPGSWQMAPFICALGRSWGLFPSVREESAEVRLY
ncbi:Mov34/MPN/PAD-1 family protein [Ciceribacter sp. RN22]|uniref:Mov34/MPN/PAD-1 family protein n=1 Tax=Ciceribacter sp. RN22 TaxID=2954932 RepID=UPI0035B0C511